MFNIVSLEAFGFWVPTNNRYFKDTKLVLSDHKKYDSFFDFHTGVSQLKEMKHESFSSLDVKHVDRRNCVQKVTALVTTTLTSSSLSYDLSIASAAADTFENSRLELITDPQTYSSILYTPPLPKVNKKFPLLVVIPGAGTNHNIMNNDEEEKMKLVWEDLTSDQGEHFGLPINLLAQKSSSCPNLLAEEFMVVSPYAPSLNDKKTRSFYNEPRSNLLSFIQFILTKYSDKVDSDEVFLFGFSDGATVAVELATTRKFKACIIAAYGYTGTLPSLALQRLKGIPFWIFHSADDGTFDNKN